jgi:hypothetical protein
LQQLLLRDNNIIKIVKLAGAESSVLLKMETNSHIALLAGTYAGLNSALIGQPFDAIKTIKQIRRDQPLTRIAINSLRERTLFKGSTPSMVSAALENATVFGVNSIFKAAYGKKTLTLTETAMIGGLSGFFSATVICPVETIKVRQIANPKLWSSATQCLVQAIRDDGARSLFHGLPAQIIRDVPFNFAFFGFYEAACRAFTYRGVDRNNLSSVETIMAGGIAGAAGWFVTIPMDILKSNIQNLRGSASKSITTSQIAKQIYQESGVRGFFRGYSAVAARAFPVNGALFFSYEFAQKQLSTIM